MGTKHLDLGCGARARNPYSRDEVQSTWPRRRAWHPTCSGRPTLAWSPYRTQIPHSTLFRPLISWNTFPGYCRRRMVATRTLKPDGLLYAMTPAYPHPASFHDPTHVNTITRGTAGYFCGETPLARMYGYLGAFTELRNDWAMLPEDFVPGTALGLRRALRRWRLKRTGRLSHLVWEFVCIKGAA